MHAMSPSETAQRQEPRGELWNASATAEYIGIARSTLYQWCNAARFPVPRAVPNGPPLWRADDVRRWLAALPKVGGAG